MSVVTLPEGDWICGITIRTDLVAQVLQQLPDFRP